MATTKKAQSPKKATEKKKTAPATAASEAPQPRKFVIDKKEKLCIVGCADSRKLTPFDRHNEFEYWGVNNLFMTMPSKHWTRWFEIHSITYDGSTYQRRGRHDFRGTPVLDYLTALGKLDVPVYTQQPWPMLPNAVIYPIQQVVQSFGDYFTNTISYMIAMGIMEGFKEIHIYGVDMAVDTEYFWQRASCEYFCGLARGMGINIVLPDTCDLLRSQFLYGFQEIGESKFFKKVRSMQESMHKRQREAEAKFDDARRKVEQYIGAQSATNEILKIQKTVSVFPATDDYYRMVEKPKKAGAK